MTGLNAALLEVNNALAAGNYSQVVAIAATIKPSQYTKQTEKDDLVLHRDIILYRAYIGLRQYQNVISEVTARKSEVAPEFLALKTLAEFHKALEGSNGTIDPSIYLDALPAIPASEAASRPTIPIIRANILASAGMLPEAIIALADARPAKVTSDVTVHGVEVLTTIGDILLRLNRSDLADEIVSSLAACGLDDLPLVQYLAAAVALAKNNPAAALSVLTDSADRYGRSARLLNALAVTRMALGAWDTAESLLLEAIGGTVTSPDTLANLATVAAQSGKGQDAVERWMGQLRATAPGHPAIVRLANLNDASAFVYLPKRCHTSCSWRCIPPFTAASIARPPCWRRRRGQFPVRQSPRGPHTNDATPAPRSLLLLRRPELRKVNSRE